MTDRPLIVEIDADADLAYVTFTDEHIERTVAIDECLNIDLDRFEVAVGLEILDLEAVIPFQELIERFHVRSEQVDMLRLIRPNMNSFMTRVQPHAQRTPSASDAGTATRC